MCWAQSYKTKMAIRKIILRIRTVNRDIFEAIRDGRKRVETRAATERYANIKAGDKLILVCGKNRLEKQVKRAAIFKTVSALLSKYKIVDVNPYAKSAKELREIYYSFPGYKEKIKKFGLVALEL